MPDLVSDHRTDAAVVHGVISMLIEEWWLQDCSGEHDLILERVIVRVDRLRRHQPFFAINWLADLVQGAVDFEIRHPHHVADQVVPE